MSVAMPMERSLVTWSCMRERRGETTRVTPLMVPLAQIAGSWKQSDLPPPVGCRRSGKRKAFYICMSE